MDREPGADGAGGVSRPAGTATGVAGHPLAGAFAAAAAPPEDADVETASDDYATRFAGAIGAWLLAEQARALAPLLDDLPRGARVLDVGGGHGQITPLLLERGFAVTVFGSGPGADRQLAPFLARGVRFASGDLRALPYPERSFDAVVSFRLLPHARAWRPLLAGLCRVATRCVIVDYPSARSVNALAEGLLFRLKRRIEHNTRPFELFAPGDVAAAFAAAGFAVRATRPQFLWPMVLHRALGAPVLARALEAPPRALGLTRLLGSPVIVRAERRP